MVRECVDSAHKGQRVDRAQGSELERARRRECGRAELVGVRALGVCGERRESRASAARGLWVWTLELSSRTSRVWRTS